MELKNIPVGKADLSTMEVCVNLDDDVIIVDNTDYTRYCSKLMVAVSFKTTHIVQDIVDILNHLGYTFYMRDPNKNVKCSHDLFPLNHAGHIVVDIQDYTVKHFQLKKDEDLTDRIVVSAECFLKYLRENKN